MSRSKKDILDTESMLQRLTALLVEHRPFGARTTQREDAESLRRISMTLHRWHELECNEDIQLGKRGPAGGFVYDDKGVPHIVRQGGNGEGTRYWRIPDREAGARKRLALILKRYPTLTAYVQGDPRGCALYILKADDIPPGSTVDSCYSRGLAVHQ